MEKRLFLRGGMLGGGCNCGPRDCDHAFKMRSNGPSLRSAKKAAVAEEKKKKKNANRFGGSQ